MIPCMLLENSSQNLGGDPVSMIISFGSWKEDKEVLQAYTHNDTAFKLLAFFIKVQLNVALQLLSKILYPSLY